MIASVERLDAVAIGATTYYTGKPCKRGHIAARQVSNGTCVECKRLADRRYQPQNSIAQKRRYWTDPDKFREKSLAWSRNNVDKVSEWGRGRYQRNRTQILAAVKARYKAKKKDIDAYTKIWRAANNDKVREVYNRRRATKRACEGSFSAVDWRLLLAKASVCFYCRKSFTSKRAPDGSLGPATHDHIIALSQGGANNLQNSVAAHRSCNSQKGSGRFHPLTGQGLLL